MTSKPLTYTVPLSISAHAIARERTIHLGRNRRRQYLNILAALSAQYFLKSVGIESTLEDLHSPLVAVMEMSDIVLPDVGQLHCQVILPGDSHLSIPEAAWCDRVGYLAIQFREDLRESKILGFTQDPKQSLPLTELEDVAALLHHITGLRVSAQPNDEPESVVNLRTWLTGKVTQGWSELSDLFNPPQLNLAFRGDRHPVSRAQPIDIGMHLGGHSLALVIAIAEDAGETLHLQTQLHPIGHDCLPPQVYLEVQHSETGATIASVSAQESDHLIQLKLEAQPGDRFRTVICHENERFTQEFLV